MLPRLHESYVKTGKVELIFLDFPLSMHNRAFQAAEAAQCAGDQEKFWEMHHELFGREFGALGAEKLVERAENLHLDLAAFEECLESGRHAAGIREDIRQVRRARVTGTPAFLLGRRIPETDKVRIDQVIRGAIPFDDLAKVIDTLLDEAP